MIVEIESKDRLVSISFDIDQTKLILSVHDLYAGTPTCKYGVDGAIVYRTYYGTWKYSCTGKWYFADIGSTHWRQATIREFIEDDMTDAWKYAMSAMKEKQFADINREIRESIREKCSTRSVKDVSLSKETLEKAKDALFGHTPFYDMLSNPYSLTVGEQECYESLKKGDDKMSKYLWHVILFNTDTEQIDFKGYIPASSGSDAQMLAAQTFGKFDPKVHAVNCKQIMSYGKEE